ncbi:MAG: DUF1566 domain-containing protein [Bacteroidales bacterium]|nr:DUF1566 domain-containing protein [Bacteroidales bacterium]MCL2132825.1 DUF1566 domain-containing protein [Bacteroidales bacterium]
MRKNYLFLMQIFVFLSLFFAFGFTNDNGDSSRGAVQDGELKIGQFYQGGIIAYIDATGKHGLIAAPGDMALDGIQWDNGSYIEIGATSTRIGTGKSNAARIVAAQGEGAYAAKLCDDLVLNGYDDWFLPSRDELNELYKNRDLIGGFDKAKYWSSSENATNAAWGQSFDGGSQNLYFKDSSFRVRAARAF